MSKFKKLKEKNQLYNKTYNLLNDYMNESYPGWAGWENQKDVKYIQMRLHQATKAILENKSRQKWIVIHKDEKILSKLNLKISDWPFVSNQVKIIKTGKLWITCIIDDKEYALNGLAQEAMPWLQFPHDAKKAIKGKSVVDFIKIGQNL